MSMRFGKGLILLALPVVFAAGLRDAVASEVRYHGMQLTDQTHLLIEQLGPAHLKIATRSRTRPEGGLDASFTRLLGQAETGRLEGVTYLAEIRVERMKPTRLNYLQSISEKYRFRIQGIGEGPFFQSVREEYAVDARQVLVSELFRMASLTAGDAQEALLKAGPIVLAVLKESRYMPAPLFTTIKESTAGQYRITERSLQRRELPGQRKLTIGPGGRPVERLTGRMAVKASIAEQKAGGPSPRAGAPSYHVEPVRAGNIRPEYISSKGISPDQADKRAGRSR